MVLISPMAIGRPGWAEKVLPVVITKKQVKNSPDVDTEKPVSRQYETGYLDYYGYAAYWEDIGPCSRVGHPGVVKSGVGFGEGDSEQADIPTAQTRTAGDAYDENDPHLRSCKTLIGYRIHAVDGDAGHVQGMLVDEETWAIRYLLVDTSNRWVGNRILVAPGNILKVSWPESIVSVSLTRQAVKDAMSYDSAVPIDERREVVVDEQHDHTSTFV